MPGTWRDTTDRLGCPRSGRRPGSRARRALPASQSAQGGMAIQAVVPVRPVVTPQAPSRARHAPRLMPEASPLSPADRRLCHSRRPPDSKGSGYTNRSFRPDAVRHMSVTIAMHRPTVTHPDTRRHKKETARRAAFPQRAGRFRRWWQVLGSNQRRLSRRFYRPLPPAPPYAL